MVIVFGCSDAASVAGLKNPSSVVHSRIVTVSVLAVTSVMQTLSSSDRTPSGGNQTVPQSAVGTVADVTGFFVGD
jgi:hypothetical protein